MGTWDEHVPRYWLEATVPTRDNGSSYPYHYYNSETIHAHTPRGVFSALLASFSKRHFLPDVFPGGSHPPQRWTKRHYQRSGRSPPLLNSQLKLWSLITLKCDLATTGCLCIAATSYTAYIAVGFSNSYNKHTEQNKTTKCLVYFFFLCHFFVLKWGLAYPRMVLNCMCSQRCLWTSVPLASATSHVLGL